MQYSETQAAELLGTVLGRLPSLATITFVESGAITWDALRICFASPRITSLTLGPHVELIETEEFSLKSSPAPPIMVSSFTYDSPFWRELYVTEFLGPRSLPDRRRGDLPEIYSRECASLSQLIPLMNQSLRQLTLPMEAAPLTLMAALTWPKLQELSIRGRYHDPARIGLLPTFLSTLPQLATLSIQVFPCLHSDTERAPILGRHHPTPRNVLCGLRSLTVAYPDPEDSIFSVDTANLAHLSIRDCPRYYEWLGSKEILVWSWPCPLLSPVECFSILSRMDMPKLTSLELVYLVDAADEDDELLKYIVATYPSLSHLELHRYRRNRDQVVDYVRPLRCIRSAQRTHAHLTRLTPAPHCDPSVRVAVLADHPSKPRLREGPRRLLC